VTSELGIYNGILFETIDLFGNRSRSLARNLVVIQESWVHGTTYEIRTFMCYKQRNNYVNVDKIDTTLTRISLRGIPVTLFAIVQCKINLIFFVIE
jgi:plasmid replication initiation protein